MKFSLNSAYNVAEIAVNQSLVRLEAGQIYETEDPDECAALAASPAVKVEASSKPKKAKDGDD